MKGAPPQLACSLLLFFALMAGCKEGASPPEKRAAARADVPPPPALVASLALRSPRRLLHHGLDHVRAFTAMPLSADTLIVALLQRVGLPPRLKDALDLDGTLRFFFLAGKGAGRRLPMVALLPLRSAKAFRQALAGAFVAAEKLPSAKLQLFVPQPGSAAGPMLVRLEGEEVVLPTSKESYRLLAPFLAGRRARVPSEHDLTLDVAVSHFSARRSAALGRALEKLKKGTKAGSRAGPRLESAVRRFSRRSAELLRSASALQLVADIDEAGLTFGLRATAKEKGALSQALARQPRAPLFALNLLPKRPAFVWASRGPGLVEVASPLDVGVEVFTSEMAAAERSRFEEALKLSRRQFGAALTFSAHLVGHRGNAAGHERGWMLTWLAEVKNVAGARQALDRLGHLVLRWAERGARRQGKKSVDRITRRPLELAGSKGALFAISRADDPAPRRPLMMAWVIKDNVAAFALGYEVESYISGLAGRIGAKSRSPLAPSVAALRQREARSGVVLLSLVESTKLLAASGVAPLAGLAGKVAGEKPTAASLLSWGTDAARARLEIDLRLPRAQFLPFKDVTMTLLRSLTRGRARGVAGDHE